ncbi:MAG TPA: hypothetical protein VIJ34_07695 [Acidimicrobiales bacterium]
MPRPGNAGANAVADHVVVLDEAVARLPSEIAAGHRIGDDPSLLARRGDPPPWGNGNAAGSNV